MLGLTNMLKSDMAAGTDVVASTMLPGALICTVPPLKDSGEVPLGLALGTTTMTTVAVEPDCSEGRLQLTRKFALAPPQVPVLADMQWKGQNRKVMLWANRSGVFYVLDRTTGEFLLGKPFIKQTWAVGIDEKGKPIWNWRR